MQYIYSDNPKHKPMNLKKCLYFFRITNESAIIIRFRNKGGWMDWEFATIEEREEVFEKILTLDNMQNVSAITQL